MTVRASAIDVTVGASSARAPQRVMFEGAHVRIEPLTPAHAEALYESCALPQHADLWTYMGDGPFASREPFAENIVRKSESADPFFFALADRASGRARGHAALMRIDAPNRVIEVGNIMVGPALQKSRAATEAQFLLARYVFDELGYRRYEWKCNDLNAPSKRAAARFGFTYEGLFRQHMIVKGRNRDTAWFSMLDTEWPARKAAFQRWLAPENFDANGQQKIALSALMKGGC